MSCMVLTNCFTSVVWYIQYCMPFSAILYNNKTFSTSVKQFYMSCILFTRLYPFLVHELYSTCIDKTVSFLLEFYRLVHCIYPFIHEFYSNYKTASFYMSSKVFTRLYLFLQGNSIDKFSIMCYSYQTMFCFYNKWLNILYLRFSLCRISSVSYNVQ